MSKQWAFLGVCPHMGGTWTVFENLREGFALHGIDLRWVVAGERYADVLRDSNWATEIGWGEVIAPEESGEKKAAQSLADHLLAHYAGAVVNVLCDRLCTNLMRYMPKSFPKILLVHSISMGTYAAARSIRDHVHATIGVSPRISNDLIRNYGFNSKHTVHIPNPAPVHRFNGNRSGDADYLRILVLSRIEDQSKGSFRIPEILRRLDQMGVPYSCTIAGDGPDLEEMKRRCNGLNVDFAGRLTSGEVPGVVAAHDAYLFPSVYEGFGLSLVEAMAGGCVPVSSCLSGVTDRIVEDQVSGFLVATTQTEEFAVALKRLFDNPGMRREMSEAARVRSRTMFSIEIVSALFCDLIQQVEREPCRIAINPKLLSNWSYPAGLRPGLRTFLPESMKNRLRLLREKKFYRSHDGFDPF